MLFVYQSYRDFLGWMYEQLVQINKIKWVEILLQLCIGNKWGLLEFYLVLIW